MTTEIKSLMLIDDDQDDQFFFTTALNQVDETIQLYTACNGVDALEKLSFVKPDLILLDLIMPRMNGLIFLKMIKRNRHLAQIPVIVYTTDLSIFNETEVLSAGAERILYKPATLQETSDKIKDILRLQLYKASA
jgi:CheY-like chemotaxis protein